MHRRNTKYDNSLDTSSADAESRESVTLPSESMLSKAAADSTAAAEDTEESLLTSRSFREALDKHRHSCQRECEYMDFMRNIREAERMCMDAFQQVVENFLSGRSGGILHKELQLTERDVGQLRKMLDARTRNLLETFDPYTRKAKKVLQRKYEELMK